MLVLDSLTHAARENMSILWIDMGPDRPVAHVIEPSTIIQFRQFYPPLFLTWRYSCFRRHGPVTSRSHCIQYREFPFQRCRIRERCPERCQSGTISNLRVSVIAGRLFAKRNNRLLFSFTCFGSTVWRYKVGSVHDRQRFDGFHAQAAS